MGQPVQGRSIRGMRRRVRKFFGTGVMLAFVCIYALAAMLVGQSEPIHRAPVLVQTLFFAVVGLAWILPLMPLIRWMERPDPDPQPRIP